MRLEDSLKQEGGAPGVLLSPVIRLSPAFEDLSQTAALHKSLATMVSSVCESRESPSVGSSGSQSSDPSAASTDSTLSLFQQHAPTLPSEEVDAISAFIDSSRETLCQQSAAYGVSLYLLPEHTGGALGLLFTPDNRVIVDLGPLVVQGESVEGKHKTVHISFDFDAGKLLILAFGKEPHQEGLFGEVEREIENAALLKDVGGCIKVQASGYHPKTEQPIVVTEYCVGGDLCNAIIEGSLTEKDKIVIFKDLIKTFNEMHEKGILHGDVKPENMFLGEGGRPIVGDLGSVCRMDDAIAKARCITSLEYASPEYRTIAETYTVPDFTEVVTPAHDMFGLGLVLYHTLGMTHFSKRSLMQGLSSEQIATVDRNSPEGLVMGMLSADPKMRLSAHEAHARLSTFEWYTARDSRIGSGVVGQPLNLDPPASPNLSG